MQVWQNTWLGVIAKTALGFFAAAFAQSAMAQDALPPQASQQLSTNLHTTVPRSKQAQMRWKMGLSGDSFANEKEQAQSAGFALGADLRYHLLDGLDVKATGEIAMESGYSQTKFGDNVPRSGFYLSEAFLRYKPVSFFTVQAGALDQGQLESPLLVSKRAFPGGLEKILIGDKKLGAELKAMQTVPTSTALSTKTVDAEPTPTFFSELLMFSLMPNDAILLRAHATHFAFHQLPSQVAQESSLFGNTLDPDGEHFKYQYQGFAAGAGAKIQFGRGFAWSFDGEMIKNTEVPESYGIAQILKSALDIGLPGDIDLRPQGEVFFTESDVSPAFYNDSEYGHSNRQGWAAELVTAFKRAGFKLGARYVNADVINQSHLQSRQEYIMLRFETLYAPVF